MNFDFENTRRDLTAIRKAHGANSPVGHAASNLIEGLDNLRSYVRPAWATDERQTLPYLVNKQAQRFARLKAASH